MRSASYRPGRLRRWIRASRLGSLAFVAAVGVACATASPPEPDHATPLAYRITAPGGGSSVLLGSIHLGRADFTTLPPELDAAFAQADLLVFEIDPAKMNPLRLALSLREMAGLPPGERLRDRIAPDTWRRLEARAEELGLSILALDALEPWAIALQLTSASLAEQGFEPTHGVEQRLAPRVGERRVIGLETPEEQLRIFDELAPALQERMLAEALEPPSPDDDDRIEVLARAWWRGDADALEALLLEEREDPELRPFYDATYVRRNRRMAERLADVLSEPVRAFSVVGVGHLVGEESVPELLEGAGLEVQRVSP